MPSFIVVTPHLVHLAPLASRNHGDKVQPVFVANGINDEDARWLESVCPEVPIIHLHASLSGNQSSLLEHGVVIDVIARERSTPFCIQDADCFITDPAFWDSMSLDPETEYAVGPFLRKANQASEEFPETFLLCLNAALMNSLRQKHCIHSPTTSDPPARAQKVLDSAGYPNGRYLDTLKDYYDTLQQYWIASAFKGFRKRFIPGEGIAVHHIGGTSYLHRRFEDLAHWDYWPLNVHYFHLKLLEFSACQQFRSRFDDVIQFHGDTSNLLLTFPKYATGWRRRESDGIIEKIGAADLYEAARIPLSAKSD